MDNVIQRAMSCFLKTPCSHALCVFILKSKLKYQPSGEKLAYLVYANVQALNLLFRLIHLNYIVKDGYIRNKTPLLFLHDVSNVKYAKKLFTANV